MTFLFALTSQLDILKIIRQFNLVNRQLWKLAKYQHLIIAQHNELGHKGEAIALQFLKNHNYVVLERNWRWQKAEVDLICKKNDVLIIIEVKTRSSTNYGSPNESVTERKEQLL